MEAACHLALQKNLDAIMVKFCCALLHHGDALPDPCSEPDEQVGNSTECRFSAQISAVQCKVQSDAPTLLCCSVGLTTLPMPVS